MGRNLSMDFGYGFYIPESDEDGDFDIEEAYEKLDLPTQKVDTYGNTREADTTDYWEFGSYLSEKYNLLNIEQGYMGDWSGGFAVLVKSTTRSTDEYVETIKEIPTPTEEELNQLKSVANALEISETDFGYVVLACYG